MRKITWKRIENALSNRLWDFDDMRKDKRICGQSLVKYVPSIFRDDENGIGMTGSQATHYVILKRIFSNVTIHESDQFLDVGCGKGRVRAFLPKTFLEFIEKVEKDLTHPITFIYWVDQQSGYLLQDRKGWIMHYREKLSRMQGIKIANCAQSYSIWTYDPSDPGEKTVSISE